MGTISGKVNVLGIANILQMLALNRQEGVLTVSQDQDHKTIYFSPEGIRLAELGRNRLHTLGEILIRTGRISRHQLDDILDEQRKTKKKLGELVRGLNLVSPAEINKALREQVEEEIHDLFLWEDATFEFTEGGPFPEHPDNPLFDVCLEANLTSLMLEAARRADELQLIRNVIPNDRVIPVRISPMPPEGDLNLDAKTVESLYPLLDGTMTVREVVSASLYPRFNVLRTLYLLAKENAIRIDVPEGEVRPRPKTRRDPAPTPEEQKRQTGPRQTLLLASELPQFRQKLAESLRSSKYHVVEQDLSADLNAAAARHGVDAAVLDLSIITEDALKLCSPLKNAMKGPIIVLSGNTSKEAVLAAIRAGARDYVVKPFNHELLLERLSQLLSK